MKRLVCLACVFILGGRAQAFDWPATDKDLDALLRDLSPKYREMAESVTKLHGYRIEATDEIPLGMVTGDANAKGVVIQLNSQLTGERRATVLIWEMANAFQRPRFDEIDRQAQSGSIATPREFGLLMELIEYDSFRHHKEVLDQLVPGRGLNEHELFFFINDNIMRLSDYALPYAYDYIKAQAAGGHTNHYESWFPRQAQKRAAGAARCPATQKAGSAASAPSAGPRPDAP